MFRKFYCHKLILLSYTTCDYFLLTFFALLAGIVDFLAIVGCLFASFPIRLGYWFYPIGDTDLLIAIFAAPLLALPIFTSFGLYRDVVRYMGFKSLWRIGQSASMYAVTWGLITFMSAIDA